MKHLARIIASAILSSMVIGFFYLLGEWVDYVIKNFDGEYLMFLAPIVFGIFLIMAYGDEVKETTNDK